MKLFLIAAMLMVSCCHTKLLETGYDETQEFWYLPADSQMVATEYFVSCVDSLGDTPVNRSVCHMKTMDKYGIPVKSDGERIEF